MDKITEYQTEIRDIGRKIKEEKRKVISAIGFRIHKERKIHEMTQDNLGSLLGISRTQVANIETGKSWITTPTLIAVCNLFNVSPNKILFGKERCEE